MDKFEILICPTKFIKFINLRVFKELCAFPLHCNAHSQKNFIKELRILCTYIKYVFFTFVYDILQSFCEKLTLTYTSQCHTAPCITQNTSYRVNTTILRV